MSLTTQDTQQESLLRLVQAGISVYCPHTAVDSTPGAIADWLADCISGGQEYETSRSVLVPSSTELEGFAGAGAGRLVELAVEEKFGTLVDMVKFNLGMRHGEFSLEFAWGKGADGEVVMAAQAATPRMIRTIALCPGSGGSMFKGIEADLYFTGEMTHHEVLAAVERGTGVIACTYSRPIICPVHMAH